MIKGTDDKIILNEEDPESVREREMLIKNNEDNYSGRLFGFKQLTSSCSLTGDKTIDSFITSGIYDETNSMIYICNSDNYLIFDKNNHSPSKLVKYLFMIKIGSSQTCSYKGYMDKYSSVIFHNEYFIEKFSNIDNNITNFDNSINAEYVKKFMLSEVDYRKVPMNSIIYRTSVENTIYQDLDKNNLDILSEVNNLMKNDVAIINAIEERIKICEQKYIVLMDKLLSDRSINQEFINKMMQERGGSIQNYEYIISSIDNILKKFN